MENINMNDNDRPYVLSPDQNNTKQYFPYIESNIVVRRQI